MRRSILYILLMQCFIHSAENPQGLLKGITLGEKIGQLFMVGSVMDVDMNREFVNRSPYHMDPGYVKELIRDYHVGGVIFLGSGTKTKLKKLVQEYQGLSKKIPLLIGLDAEWGLSMRLIDGNRYPRNMTLGAIEDNELIQELGKQIGRECVELGVHINFAPVVDINTNPNNPVIGMRSFGQNRRTVFEKAASFMWGLHAAGVLSCAKHFPGHGDTDVDSHVGLPVVNHDSDRLHSVELWPFKKLIKAHVPAVMMGHLSVPALDKSGEPATLSQEIITGLLRRKLDFDGLVVTDGLGMQAILEHNKPGKLELKALLAGNDILLCPVDVPKAVALITQAIEKKDLAEQELDTHVMCILSVKAKLQELRISQESKMTSNDITPNELNRKLYEAAITLVDDQELFVPLTKKSSACMIQIGDDDAFYKQLAGDVSLEQYRYNVACQSELQGAMKKADITLCVITGINSRSIAQFDDPVKKQFQDVVPIKEVLDFIKKQNAQVIFINFCSPYLVKHLQDHGPVIQAYEYDVAALAVAKEVLFGQREANSEI